MEQLKKEDNGIDRKDTLLSQKLADAMIIQLSKELYNHNLYKSFEIYFASYGLTKIEKYYKKRAEEEYNHHKWFEDRLKENDIIFPYPEIKEVYYDFEKKDFVAPFKATVDAEIETTDGISNIAKIALEEGDFITFEWLGRVLLQEQHEEESTSRTALDIAEREDTSWEIKAQSIYDLLEY